MNLNECCNLIRNIVRNTTNTEITIRADDEENIWKFRISLDHGDTDYLSTVLRILRRTKFDATFDSSNAELVIEDRKKEA